MATIEDTSRSIDSTRAFPDTGRGPQQTGIPLPMAV